MPCFPPERSAKDQIRKEHINLQETRCVCVPGSGCQGQFSPLGKLRWASEITLFNQQEITTAAGSTRQVMDDQLLVLQFTGFDIVEGENDREENTSKFIHLGYINKKTWHFAGMSMAACHNVHSLDSSVLQLAVPLIHLGDHLTATDIEIIQKVIPFDMKWVVTILKISQNPDHWALGDRTSSLIPVEPLTSIEKFIVWQGSEKESAMRRANATATADTGKKSRDSKKRELDPLAEALRLTQPKRRKTQKGAIADRDVPQEPNDPASNSGSDVEQLTELFAPSDAQNDDGDELGDVVSEVESDQPEEYPELDELDLVLSAADAVECPTETAVEHEVEQTLESGLPASTSGYASAYYCFFCLFTFGTGVPNTSTVTVLCLC